MNNVVLVGRITRDVELRSVSVRDGYKSTANAVVAVERPYRNQNGERDADFIRCVIWGKSAEAFAQYTHKGARVAIQGRIQTRRYENQQGQTVYVTEVLVENFDLLESKAESEAYRERNGFAQGQGAVSQGNYGQGQYGQQGGFTQGQGNFGQFGQGQYAAVTQKQGASSGTGSSRESVLSEDDFPF